MNSKTIFRYGGVLICGVSLAALIAGCGTPPASPDKKTARAGEQPADPTSPQESASQVKPAGSEEEHEHAPGAHGGRIVSLGRDSYHVEAIITNTGEIRLYMLGSDETRVKYTEIQDLTAYVKVSDSDTESIPIPIAAQPQPGDSSGMTSLFVGQLPEEMIGKAVDVTIPNLAMGEERFRVFFTTQREAHAGMPGKVTSDAERELYLTPGGLYTAADIEANGNQTATQKFAGFMAAHDLKPKPGDKICPITLTKANPQCAWVVDGKSYEFCCPPCVDEFVRLAKTRPQEVKPPDAYVKTGEASDQ